MLGPALVFGEADVASFALLLARRAWLKDTVDFGEIAPSFGLFASGASQAGAAGMACPLHG